MIKVKIKQIRIIQENENNHGGCGYHEHNNEK